MSSFLDKKKIANWNLINWEITWYHMNTGWPNRNHLIFFAFNSFYFNFIYFLFHIMKNLLKYSAILSNIPLSFYCTLEITHELFSLFENFLKEYPQQHWHLQTDQTIPCSIAQFEETLNIIIIIRDDYNHLSPWRTRWYILGTLYMLKMKMVRMITNFNYVLKKRTQM